MTSCGGGCSSPDSDVNAATSDVPLPEQSAQPRHWVLRAPTVIDGAACHRPGWVAVGDGVITGVGRGEPPAGLPGALREYDSGVLTPGLVDMQLNGAFGVDLSEAGTPQWLEVMRRLPATGCTGVVPTVITAPVPELTQGLRDFAARRKELDAQPGAARCLDMHVEGPFLSERRRGAHRAELLCDPEPEVLGELLRAADGALGYLTLAPERSGALRAIRQLVAAGIRVAIGHSDASDQQAFAAADAGATLVTHLFNGQRGLHHRAPGLAGAALTDPRLTVGLIADLHHVLPTALQVSFHAAASRIALVTDAVSAMGRPQGRYRLGGEEITLGQSGAPFRADGTLAGSALRMDQAVANAHAQGVDLLTAVRSASVVPAAAMGCPQLGHLRPGAPADVVWLDGRLRCGATWIDGVLSHDEGAAA